MSMREDWEQHGWDAGWAGKPMPEMLSTKSGSEAFVRLRNQYVQNGYAEGVKERERKNAGV